MPFQFTGEEDAEYVEVGTPGPQAVPTVERHVPNYEARGVINLSQDVVLNPNPAMNVDALAMYEKRARAVTLFIKVPFLSYLALNSKLPPMVRLGAGLLALWEATQIARGQTEIEQTVTEWAQQ
jgi:hypothetical protein